MAAPYKGMQDMHTFLDLLPADLQLNILITVYIYILLISIISNYILLILCNYYIS